jgi:cytochrome d ubiquinol oxidase subunit I
VSFTLLYAVLAVVEIGLVVKYVRAGADPVPEQAGPSDSPDRPLAFAY